jgi:toxin CcdB
MAGIAGYVLDIQANFLGQLDTRLVVPLLLAKDAPQPAVRLNPRFHIDGENVVMMTQFMASVPRGALGAVTGNLSDHHDEIVSAVDFLMQGF